MEQTHYRDCDYQHLADYCVDEVNPVWLKSNLVNVPSTIISCSEFNRQPIPMTISGARQSAENLFSQLALVKDVQQAGEVFQQYMKRTFGPQQQQPLTSKQHRYKTSYLKLLQDWGIDANHSPAAVMKGWVESRFGLLPIFHKQPLKSLLDKSWIDYVEDRMNCRYHNNSIYLQLDLLFEFCQWFINRYKLPAGHFKTLYRGVNDLDEQCIKTYPNKRRKLVRFNNIVSFTDNEVHASEFGDTILRVTVPMVKLVFFPQLLPQHALNGESEYLVIGGNYEVELL